LANTGFQTAYNYIGLGLEPELTSRCYAREYRRRSRGYAFLVIWNSGKWNSVKWNEIRWIGAIFACFYVARVWQRQLGFLVKFHAHRYRSARWTDNRR